MRLLLPVVLFLCACSGGGGYLCGPDTCGGCCDSTGLCQTGDLDSACGEQGARCDVCPSSIHVCAAGRCVDKSATGGGGEGGGTAGGGTAGGGAAGGAAGGVAGGAAGGGMSCTPETNTDYCARNHVTCGPQQGLDNCLQVRTITSCGSCGAGMFCSNGACACQPETNAQFCSRLTTSCGPLTAADNCGAMRTASCGSCTTPNTCSAGRCVCVAETDAQFCARRGVSCGYTAGFDNCGLSRAVQSCGTCTGVNQCIAGSCSCPAETNAQFCTRLGAQCGSVSGTDTCGNPRNVASCGSCTGVNTCAGGGMANKCGCTAQTDAELCAASNTSCGAITVTDRCGMSRTVASCGSCTSGTRCPTTSASNRACQPFTCLTNERACGQVCAACPTTGVSTTTCGAGDTCVAATCQADYALMNGTCQPVVCPSGQRSCGGVCRSCPTSGVVTTACNGPACIAASCVDGSGVSGGACVPMTCPAGKLFCSTACATCPTTGAATFGCDVTSCSVRTCQSGYTVVGTLCIDSDWTTESIDTGVNGYFDNVGAVALALGPGGVPYAAYVVGNEVSVAKRTAAGSWTKVRTTGLAVGTNSGVMKLAIDAAGNAHVVFQNYTYLSGYLYIFRYVKISPTGATSLSMELGRTGTSGDLYNAGIALGLDTNGDAHVAYNGRVGTAWHVKYRRTYQGAWLAAIDAAPQMFEAPAIYVEGPGDIVHVASIRGYIKGTSSIFTAPVALPTPGSYGDTFIYANGSTLELWGTSDGADWWWTTLNLTSIAAPVTWASGGYSGAGARGPAGFSLLELTQAGTISARRGPTSGSTLTEVTNLPLYGVLESAAMDGNGTMHALAWRNGSSPIELLYVRGH